METMEKKQTFKALSKICLNNWHYIERKVLTLSEGINFFTGHSGSGKSTVIDALQIVLYANTDGRGFFNKAAADDSDRNLIEYLRGMVSVGDNNDVNYLRNKNFSSTIVLELEQTSTKEKECVGIVFDVETSTNEISRLFFWHKGGLLEHHYRNEERCLATSEVRDYLQRHFAAEDHYFGSSNERFRRQLYDIYLGGLDMEKFPRLFKRAIPFKMNIKLEEFVKEYICMEQDIQIDDMQQSVMQYGRMRKKIEDTMKEIERLSDIHDGYERYRKKKEEWKYYEYRIGRLEMLSLEEQIGELKIKLAEGSAFLDKQRGRRYELEKALSGLSEQYDELVRQIASSGYDKVRTELEGVNALLEELGKGKAKWDRTGQLLAPWKELEVTPNQTIWDIEKFETYRISIAELERLKGSLRSIRDEVEEERQDYGTKLRSLKKRETAVLEELKELKQGRKAYPKELEEARYELRTRLSERCKKFVNVQIFADLLDVKNEEWHKAIEGYLGANKLSFIIEPQYVKEAMDIYAQMDQTKYWRVAIVDTENILKKEHPVKEHALAEEIIAKEPYVKAFVDLLLGNVLKCRSVEELRRCRIGVTPDCMLYQNCQLRRMNPDNYTRSAYIGETSLRQRIRQLEEERASLEEQKGPLEQALADAKQILGLEYLSQSIQEYSEQLESVGLIKGKTKQKQSLEEKIQKLQRESVGALKAEVEGIRRSQEEKRAELEQVKKDIWSSEEKGKEQKQSYIDKNEELTQKQRAFVQEQKFEQSFLAYMEDKKNPNYIALRNQNMGKAMEAREDSERVFEDLVELRTEYLRKYPQRTFCATARENEKYDGLLNDLQCDDLEKYRERANEQAKSAVEHFKDDFIFKIRSAIREAFQRRDELNRIINKLNFGKDKYKFVVTKNKGADGQYYKMFMDDSLQIDPSTLGNAPGQQMNLFSMEHENNYGELMNELIHIFIPPDDANGEELEEAKRNMDKYADYRTYLSFDMEQIIQGEEQLTIGLSRMIKKNSGGEGQNPLYVALLASFAQAYKINLPPKIRRSPTIRLVVLDEAFSKMDAEKVASCIALIRGLGFQAIISATNDKIQNYLENVDKTFVYANPNKKSISIQEFERKEFQQLL